MTTHATAKADGTCTIAGPPLQKTQGWGTLCGNGVHEHRQRWATRLALTNASGNITTQYGYDPFGNTTSNGGTSTNVFQYTGRENDGNGLYSYRARYYSPALSRFISEDPNGFRGGINEYSYALNDPISNIDPSGLATAQFGGTFSLTGFGLTFTVSGGIAIDSSGNTAVYGATGGGLGLGFGGSATADGYGSNAVNVNDLAGPFVNGTVGGGAGLDAAVGTFGGNSKDGAVMGSGLSVGVGAGAAGSVTVTYTKVCDWNCLMNSVAGILGGRHCHQR